MLNILFSLPHKVGEHWHRVSTYYCSYLWTLVTVTILDFHYMIILSKTIHINDIIAYYLKKNLHIKDNIRRVVSQLLSILVYNTPSGHRAQTNMSL